MYISRFQNIFNIINSHKNTHHNRTKCPPDKTQLTHPLYRKKKQKKEKNTKPSQTQKITARSSHPPAQNSRDRSTTTHTHFPKSTRAAVKAHSQQQQQLIAIQIFAPAKVCEAVNCHPVASASPRYRSCTRKLFRAIGMTYNTRMIPGRGRG